MRLSDKQKLTVALANARMSADARSRSMVGGGGRAHRRAKIFARVHGYRGK